MLAGCATAIIIRYLLYVAGAPAYFAEEHLYLVSPMTSHKRLMEGLFLLEGGASPYGGTCHHPPLVLLCLSWLRQAPPLAQFAFIAALDVATALLLRHLAAQFGTARPRAGRFWAEGPSRMNAVPNTGGGDKQDLEPPALDSGARALEDVVSPDFVGLIYLLNPIVLASCLSLSLQNLQHFVFCLALCFASRGMGGLTAAACALAMYICPFTTYVLIMPCAYLSFTRRQDRVDRETAVKDAYVRSKDTALMDSGFMFYLLRFVIATSCLFICLLAASVVAMRGSLDFIQASFVSVLTVMDLQPNVGIFWYIFQEVFDRYRTLFILVFHGHLLFFPLPLHLRLGRHRPIGPWLHCGAAMGILAVFKPYPTASDFALLLSMLLIQAELIQEAKHSFAFLLSGTLFGLCMFPVMTAVWLTRNAGNANFLYNMTLVVNVFGCLLISEWIRAGMRLRRRQHLHLYCNGVVQDIVEAVLRGDGSSKATHAAVDLAEKGAPKIEATAGDGKGEPQSGLRKRGVAK